MRELVDITGQEFGRLIVTEFLGKSGQSHAMWKCLCACGNSIVTRGSALLSGHTKSCGCLQKDIIGDTRRIHGMSQTKIGEVWENIKARCYRERDRNYSNYGGRGIYVCAEWLNNPIKFFEWAEAAGYTPGLQIDRIDNDGPYSPENCCWSSREAQARNKRNNHLIAYKGKAQCLAAWAVELGISVTTITSRLSRGYSIEEALSVINRKTGGLLKDPPLLIVIKDEALSAKEWRKKLGIAKTTYYSRLRDGFTPEQALLDLMSIKKRS